MHPSIVIREVVSQDKRYVLPPGAGSDAVHTAPTYGYAVCVLRTDRSEEGVGLAFTLGTGNPLVCEAIRHLAGKLVGQEIHALMAGFGRIFRTLADDAAYRWLGPHKGVVHLALAAITNACFDLWAKAHQVPLWKLLNDLSPEALLDAIDISYLEDVLPRAEALGILTQRDATRKDAEQILRTGYRGYDTSVGWFEYSDGQIRDNVRRAMDAGFTAMKLKVGSKDAGRDIRRAMLVREVAGDTATIMLDANQQWSLPDAIRICSALQPMNPYWIEEPTHPDDVQAHRTLADAIAPLRIALGEHVPNRVLFKNYLQTGAMSFNQADAVRVGGVAEYIAISLLSRKFNIPMVPHVGDMGQIHQHLVLFNHIRVGHEALFLEYIPHLRDHFVHPARVTGGFYQVPQEPGLSAALR
ncbi:enolase C-terminal domain-like protein [Dawidia soli]|uniref:Mandelate racemase n=1 Tax=Dawidia soli TaxID=2782352 RepID=A0AAP2DCK3_9BACT|nr:enolase C-terminal domain-like protein [Dawidia soli]MBT1689278.1 mandelate racemase [Dawidia soli]